MPETVCGGCCGGCGCLELSRQQPRIHEISGELPTKLPTKNEYRTALLVRAVLANRFHNFIERQILLPLLATSSIVASARAVQPKKRAKPSAPQYSECLPIEFLNRHTSRSAAFAKYN